MATETKVLPYAEHHSPERQRHGFWRCLRCRTRLMDSLAIGLHVGTVKESEIYSQATRSVVGCTAGHIVFECRDDGLEAA